tara:strand:+ start:1768 stop:1914 length:147 start_codon:yes stop_codon:yes gene_type:complete
MLEILTLDFEYRDNNKNEVKPYLITLDSLKKSDEIGKAIFNFAQRSIN